MICLSYSRCTTLFVEYLARSIVFRSQLDLLVNAGCWMTYTFSLHLSRAKSLRNTRNTAVGEYDPYLMTVLQRASAASAAPALLTVNLPGELIHEGVQRFIVAPIDVIQIPFAFPPGLLPIFASTTTSTTIHFASSTSSSTPCRWWTNRFSGASGGGLAGECWRLPTRSSSGGGEEVRLDGQRGCGFAAASSQQVFVVE